MNCVRLWSVKQFTVKLFLKDIDAPSMITGVCYSIWHTKVQDFFFFAEKVSESQLSMFHRRFFNLTFIFFLLFVFSLIFLSLSFQCSPPLNYRSCSFPLCLIWFFSPWISLISQRNLEVVSLSKCFWLISINICWIHECTFWSGRYSFAYNELKLKYNSDWIFL